MVGLMVRTLRQVVWVVAFVSASFVACAQQASPRVISSRDEVFQFMQSGTRSDWADGARTTATAYLWIPEQCVHLRGLIILGTNVPEQMLAENHTIREVAATDDLGIVWSTPTFWYSKSKNEDAATTGFLQDLLDGLARTSGYDEVATVPWFPIGESGHLLMVDALVKAAPQKVAAALWLKNPHTPPVNPTVPSFVVFGTGQEWGQDKADYRMLWRNTDFYDTMDKLRAQHPGWPLTYFLDPASGHFDVSRQLTDYIARYIDAMARLRLPKEPGGALRTVDLNSGFSAEMQLPGHTGAAPTAYAATPAEQRSAPWFPDRASAAEAQAIDTVNWNAESQLPAFFDAAGKQAPFDFNGISSYTPVMDVDGITFHLTSRLLDKLPENFQHAGESLAKGPSQPVIEWMCGAVTPAGGDAFRVALDRGYRQQAIYLVARAAGSANVRGAVQPVAIKLQKNGDGRPQKITFAPISDVKLGTDSVPLSATSDAGLPVRFFVVAGPAFVQGDRLIFTALPPRTEFPVAVTVAAWQWGRSVDPKVKTADTVRQTFLITH